MTLRTAVLIVAVGQALDAQHHQIPSIPQAVLERPIGLRTGIGAAHDAVSTRSREAQALYDQGLAYLHSYAWIDAARSFHDALRADATLAMAHVGLSLAYEEVNKPAAARTALERARALAADASAHDRGHVEIRSTQMAGDAAAYRAALDVALAAFPSDAELWLLRGIAESPDAADRGQGADETSIKFYERALTLSPGYFAAHHYLVHAHENAGRVDAALARAREYVRLAPAVPHAHHMLGHNLRRTGQPRQAIDAFRKAHELETAAPRAEEVPAHYDWHHQHNLDLLGTSHQYIGQVGAAERFLRTSFEMPSPLVVQELNKHEWPSFLLARGRVDEAQTAAEVLTRSPAGVVRAMGHVMKGHAWLASSEVAKAAEASNLALKELRAAGPEAALAAPHLQGLQAELHLRTGQRDTAAARFREVRRKLRALPGPDGWSQALFRLEAIGRAAAAEGAWQIAAETAADMREHDPSYGGTHYLTALVAEHAGDNAAAQGALERAQQAWRDADPDFTDLTEMRSRLADMRTRLRRRR